MTQRAIFFDRDGTLNNDPGYISSPKQLKLYPGARKAIKLAKDANFLTFVVSNQSGIGRQYFTTEQLHSVHEHMQNVLARDHAQVHGIYFCPHHPDAQCACRKPKTDLIRQILQKYAIDLAASYVIGDKNSDLLLAQAIGAQPIIVLTGHGLKTLRHLAVKPAFIAKDALVAVKWILDQH